MHNAFFTAEQDTAKSDIPNIPASSNFFILLFIIFVTIKL